MVKLGKMMWNAKVKPAWMRSSRTGSRFIAGLADRPFPDGPQYRPARRNRTAGLRPGALRPWTSGKIPNAEQSSRAILRRSCRLFGGTSQEIAMSDTIGETTAAAGHVCALDRYFGLTRNGTEPRTEIIAGVTTFLTMAYIVFVNPQILGAAGMDQGAVFAATCLAAAASTLTMGIYANYPIALETSGVIVAHPATLVTLGDLTKPAAILALVGFVLIAALNQRRIIGGTLLGILAVTLIGLPLGLTHYSGVVSMPPSLAPTLLQLDFSRAAELTFVIIVLSILFVDVFDNAGTLIGVTHRTGLMRDGKLARMKEALISDSFAAIFGSLK